MLIIALPKSSDKRYLYLYLVERAVGFLITYLLPNNMSKYSVSTLHRQWKNKRR